MVRHEQELEVPTLYLICGPVGSGKTTYANRLVEQGIIKLSIDECMAAYGRPRVDYPVEQYQELESRVMARHKVELAGHLALGRSVALDYGFKSRRQRDEYKDVAEQNCAAWRLMYLQVPREILWDRVEIRNQDPDLPTGPIDEAMFSTLMKWFEEPLGEGEEIVGFN